MARSFVREMTRRLRRRLAIVAATRRWRPDHINLVASGHRIYVDPRDPRGWEIVRGLGRGHQPALIALWQRINAELRPALAIDVGANYGEMTLSARYPAGTRLVAVEPNPKVAALLRRSVSRHPDASRMKVLEAVASDIEGSATLRIPMGWSGQASVVPLDSPDIQEVSVPAHRLDDQGPELPDGGTLAIKVDVEGWELAVLRGASDLLRRAGTVVVLAEFDPDHLRRAGTDPAELLQLLESIGRVVSIARDGAFTPVLTVPTAPTDLLAISDSEAAARLGLPAAS